MQILTGEGRSFFIPEDDGADDSDLLTEYAAQQLEKAIPTMENTVIACDEANAHDVLWGLDAGVQYVIVIWPEDIASGTCGINAINSSSEGLLPVCLYE